MRPITQNDIERLYADPDAGDLDLSAAVIEHHVQRGRVMRSQMAAAMLKQAGSVLWRLVAPTGRHPAAPLKTSNV